MEILQWIKSNWSTIALMLPAMASAVVFYQNILTIRKLRKDIRELTTKAEERERRIYLPTTDEVEKYGQMHDQSSPLLLLMIILILFFKYSLVILLIALPGALASWVLILYQRQRLKKGRE